MTKNIVIFSDGTGQDGGVRPEQRVSNVYKMFRACRVGPDSAIDPREQVSLYDAGLGTDVGATALTSPVRTVQKLIASVTGRGITTNIAECYEFIVNHYQPGDRIFLIGFSRGAYTVRAVANLIRLCGVPTAIDGSPLPRFRKAIRDVAHEAVNIVLEHGAGHPRDKYEDEREEQARRFRVRYGSEHASGEERRSNAAPYFIGVFDTVAALGAKGLRRVLIQGGLALGTVALIATLAFVPAAAVAGLLQLVADMPFWRSLGALIAAVVFIVGAAAWLRAAASSRKTIRDFPNKGDVSRHRAIWKGDNFDRLLSRFVSYARSANAIDETRADFARVKWGGPKDASKMVDGHERLIQLWFAGNHSDIGGSYPETESRLSDIALHWMVGEATMVPNGLKIDGLKAPGDASDNPHLRVFPASDGVQHCEIADMQDTLETRLPRFLRRLSSSLNWKVKVREINPKADVHPSVVERFALASVAQCNSSGPYRPKALATHEQFEHLYAPMPRFSEQV